jgi:hypothetical protein
MTNRVDQASVGKTGVATARDIPDAIATGLPGTMKEVGERVAGVLRAAEQSARGIFATVEKEASGVRERADQMLRTAEADLAARRDEGQRLISSSKELSEALIAKANREVEQIRTDALAEVARLHDAARRIQTLLTSAGETIAQSVEILPELIRELGGGDEATTKTAGATAEATAKPVEQTEATAASTEPSEPTAEPSDAATEEPVAST